MRLNIIIPTRNGAPKLAALLKSLKKIEQDINVIIVVDDSTKKMQNRAIKKLCRKFGKIVLVDNEKLNLLNFPKKSSILRLGTNKWNLGNARNIGILYSLAFSDTNAYTVFLDDDMVVLKGAGKHIKDRILGRINIIGAPDLSKLEWLQLYLKYKEPQWKSYNDYIEAVYNKLKHKSIALISEYTNLSSYQTKKSIKFPQRSELSGGAFICSNNILPLAFFPNWFDEDWLWFYSIRESAGIKIKGTSLVVLHNSSKKEILDLNSLIFEEDGKIMTNSLKKSPDINKLKDKVIKEIYHRKALVSNILSAFNSLEDKNRIDMLIVKRLALLHNYLINITPSRYIKEILKFIKLQKYLKENQSNLSRDIRGIENG
ncbi:MAG TPA: glycosyltransferase family 2 protein [Nanoarchaeota archaeon]|nr:glycosyltransferase family 2 protein [Nanoarchaeota archaeon]